MRPSTPTDQIEPVEKGSVSSDNPSAADDGLAATSLAAVPSGNYLDATEVRFGTRAMLITTAAVAMAALATSTFIHQFPQDKRPVLAIYWGILAAVACCVVGYVAWKRYQAEQAAGHVLYRLAPHSYVLPRAPEFVIMLTGVSCLVVAMLLGAMVSVQMADSKTDEWWKLLNVNSLYVVITFGAGIRMLWWRGIRVSDRGLLIGNDLVPWDHCRRWYWDACTKNVAVIGSDKHKSIAVQIPADDRAAIQSLLDCKIKRPTSTVTSPQAPLP